MGSEKPTKAYEVERISRTVTTIIVHADSPEDAKRRSAKYGEAEDAEHEHRGFGAVRRRPESDLPKGPSNE